MTKRIYAIHGAFSTPTIFNFLKLKLKDYTWEFLDYHADVRGVSEICDRICINEPCHVIGHSMGGLIALSAADHINVASITTIATPLDGLDVNAIQAYLTRSGFINEIAHRSRFMQQLHAYQYTQPVQHIITTNGFNPFMYTDNDGVVSLKSQRGWAAGPTIEVAANHSEVMMHSDTVQAIKRFLAASD
jgi:pimeloyl-ACP methyl ester carboxylesterase